MLYLKKNDLFFRRGLRSIILRAASESASETNNLVFYVRLSWFLSMACLFNDIIDNSFERRPAPKYEYCEEKKSNKEIRG